MNSGCVAGGEESQAARWKWTTPGGDWVADKAVIREDYEVKTLEENK